MINWLIEKKIGRSISNDKKVSNVTCVYREQVELCVDILERILMALSPEHLAQNYRAELQAGLNHPNETVKILALTQVSCSHTYKHRQLPTTHLPNQAFLLFFGRLAEWWSTPMLSPKSSTTTTFFEEWSTASEKRKWLSQNRWWPRHWSYLHEISINLQWVQ